MGERPQVLISPQEQVGHLQPIHVRGLQTDIWPDQYVGPTKPDEGAGQTLS